MPARRDRAVNDLDRLGKDGAGKVENLEPCADGVTASM